jgi:RHS repeat-associated protein
LPGTWGHLISQQFSVTGLSEAMYYAFDQQGNCRWANGSTAVFGAFGEQLSTFIGLFGYEGQYGYLQNEAVDSSHMFLGARVLDVNNGRFIGRDLIGSRAGYVYVGNNPVNGVDPTGRQTVGRRRRVPPGIGIPLPPTDPLGRCFTMSPGACFPCAYNYLLNTPDSLGGFPSPRTACDLANQYCGSHVNCAGESRYPHPPAACSTGAWYPYLPFPPGPPEGFTDSECQLACTTLFPSSGGAQKICRGICNAVKDYSCNDLFEYCGAIAGNNTKKICLIVYNTVCLGK